MKLVALFLFLLNIISYSQENKIKIGISFYSQKDSFLSVLKTSIDEYLKSLDNDSIEVRYADAKNSESIQDSSIDSFITDNFDILCINPVNRLDVVSMINKAKATNTPLIFFNKEPLKSDIDLWDKIYYIGSDSEQAGFMQAKLFYESFKNNPSFDKNKDGVIQYVIIKGEPGHQYSIGRTKGIKDFFIKNGIKSELLFEESGMMDLEKSQQVMGELLSSKEGGKIEVVFANDDIMAIGALKTITNSNQKIPVLGINGIKQAIDLIEEKVMFGTIINDAQTKAKDLIDLAINLAKNLPEQNNIKEKIIDKHIYVDYKNYVEN